MKKMCIYDILSLKQDDVMKKIITVLSIIVMILLIYIIYIQCKETNTIKNEIKELNEIIGKRQDINKEYIILLEQNKEKNIDEEIQNEKEIINQNKQKIEELQNDINEKQVINTNILNEIQETQIKIEKKLEESTVKIDREITYNQFPNYPTGCESVALYILLKYNGIETTPDEIISRLKLGNLPYNLDGISYGGNPEIEFIGDPRNDYSYGVYNNPIAEVAETYKENVQNKQGVELEELLELIKENRPVMVWSTINNMESKIRTSWIYRDTGEVIYWKSNEHALVIIGYNDKYIIVSDPYNGKIMRYEKNKFKRNYNFLGKRAVYY